MTTKMNIKSIDELNVDTYAKIIVEMMKDYKITMFDALLWDFESSLMVSAENIYDKRGLPGLESAFRNYLENNGIALASDKDFYADIFMGRSNNMELKVAKTPSK